MMATGKVHTCLVCGYETKYTSNMRKHLRSLLPCGNVDADDPKYVDMLNEYINKAKPEKQHECSLCGKLFKCRTSIYKHRDVCVGRLKMEDEIRKLKEKIEKLENREQNITVNNIVNNNTINNIIINSFGSENLERVLKNQQLLDQCVKRRDKGQVELLKYIHFRMPENKNIQASKRANMIRVLVDGEWELHDDDDVKEVMIKHSHGVLSDHLENNRTRLLQEFSETLRRDIDEYLRAVERNNFEVIHHLKNKIQAMISEQGATTPR